MVQDSKQRKLLYHLRRAEVTYVVWYMVYIYQRAPLKIVSTTSFQQISAAPKYILSPLGCIQLNYWLPDLILHSSHIFLTYNSKNMLLSLHSSPNSFLMVSWVCHCNTKWLATFKKNCSIFCPTLLRNRQGADMV